MQIDESRKLLLSDTLVPDIFIAEHLPSLSGLAVKIYIFLLFVARTERSVSEKDLARRMGEEEEIIKTALTELAGRDLIFLQEHKLQIADIKEAEIERIYRPRTSSEPAEILEKREQYSRREKLMADISKTFFQGLMSPSWYTEIDTWFDRYNFEPEVIYALFQECARRNKLDSKAYINRVAENWSARGIMSYQDLNQYFLAYDKVNKVTRKIGRKLRKNMTVYDEEIISRWVEKMGFDFDVIDLALRKTVKIANPNLAYIDRILEEWFAHQLRTPEAVKEYESHKAGSRSKSAKGGRNDSAAGRKNVGNFSQREYSDEYLNGFYEEVDHNEQQEKTAVKSGSDKQIALNELTQEENIKKDSREGDS